MHAEGLNRNGMDSIIFLVNIRLQLIFEMSANGCFKVEDRSDILNKCDEKWQPKNDQVLFANRFYDHNIFMEHMQTGRNVCFF